jgi:hypothetical protein
MEKTNIEKRIIRKIVMSVNREILTFLIIERNIYYSDRKFHALIRVLPKPRNLLATIAKSRNRIPMFILQLFNLSKAEMDEYNAAQTIDDLAEIIISDGKKNGCILVANGDMEVDTELIAKIESQEVVI